jgi:uncharacterized protein (UPF0303 family)
MTPSEQETAAKLGDQEARLLFDAFDHREAWRLGTLMVDRALRERAPVIIDIRRPGLVLFRAALSGTTAENEAWLERKARTVFRFDASTALVSARFAAQGVDPWKAAWFDAEQFTTAGGAVPVRVRGVGVVAAVTVSGLASELDHDFVVESLTTLLKSQGSAA